MLLKRDRDDSQFCVCHWTLGFFVPHTHVQSSTFVLFALLYTTISDNSWVLFWELTWFLVLICLCRPQEDKKIKSRRSGETDLLSDYRSMDIMLGNINLGIPDEDMDCFANAFINLEINFAETNRENSSIDNRLGTGPDQAIRTNRCNCSVILRVLQGSSTKRSPKRLKTWLKLWVPVKHDAIETAINEKILPRIQNAVSNLINGAREDGMIPSDARINQETNGLKLAVA